MKGIFTKHCTVAKGGTADVPELRFATEAQLRGEDTPSAQLLLIRLACQRAEAHELFPRHQYWRNASSSQKGGGRENHQLGKLGAAHLGGGGPGQPGISHERSGLCREATGSPSDGGALGWQPSRSQVTGGGGRLQAFPVIFAAFAVAC